MTSKASVASFRVPEPGEIAQWARERGAALRSWFQVPANQWLVTLLVVGLLVRLSALDLAPFGPAQARWLTQARQAAAPAAIAAATDAGLAAPDLLTAVLALGLGHDGDARGAIALLALLQMGALTALALSVNRHLGHTPALVAAGILGLSPWLVFAARDLLPAALTLTASLALLAALLAAIVGRNGWAWAASALLAVLALANEPQAVALGLVWLGAVILHYDRVRWAPLAIGLALAAAVAFGVGLGGALLSNLLASARGAPEGGYLERLLTTVRQTASLLVGGKLAALTSPDEAGQLLTHTLFERLRQLVALAFWVALPWAAWQAVQGWSRWQERGKGPERALLALWLWLPLLLSPRLSAVTPGLSGASTSAYLMAPAGAVAMGLLLDAVPGWLRRSGLTEWRWVWRALLGVGALALAANLYAAVATPRLAARQDMHLGYGAPYRFWRLTEGLVARGRARSQADQLWMQASEPQAATARELFPQAALLRDDSGQLLPAARPALYLQWRAAEAAAATAAQDNLLERLGSRELGAVEWPDGSQAVVFELRERPVEELLALAPERANAHFDAGMYLVGYDWPSEAAPGATLELATYWTFGDLSSRDQATAYTVHLAVIAADGQQLVWSGPLALDGAHWQEGLLLRQATPFALPETWPRGPAQVYAEVHRASDGQAVALLDAPLRPGDSTAYLGQVLVN